MAHKGKATSDVSYSVSDGPEAYNNPSFGRRIAEYTKACEQKYGEDYNESEHEIDTDIVMALGGGKKHERLWIGDGIINSSSLRLADV
jgi:glycerol dehydrogenase-like iron-containing ADH family enzyme